MTTSSGTPDMTPAMRDLMSRISAVHVTASDTEAANRIRQSGNAPAFVDITPGIAVVLLREGNRAINRNLSVPGVRKLERAIVTGHWYMTHQGAAFYADGSLADGQHRLAAIAVGGKTVKLLVVCDLDPNALRGMDRPTASRTLEQTMSLVRSLANSKEITRATKLALDYKARADGEVSPVPEWIAEDFIVEHINMVNKAMALGADSMTTCTSPAMKLINAQSTALLMLIGNYTDQQIKDYLTAVQTGTSRESELATGAFNRALDRSNRSRGKDKLTSLTILGMAALSASQWVRGLHVTRLNVDLSEAVPPYAAPEPVPVAQAAE